MNRIGFYAGSFDPFTYGHLHIVKEALTLFDFLIIGIACNPKKNSRRFPAKIIGQYETIYFRSNTDLDYISSSMVMELYNNDENISEYIPKAIYKKIKK